MRSFCPGRVGRNGPRFIRSSTPGDPSGSLIETGHLAVIERVGRVSPNVDLCLRDPVTEAFLIHATQPRFLTRAQLDGSPATVLRGEISLNECGLIPLPMR